MEDRSKSKNVKGASCKKIIFMNADVNPKLDYVEIALLDKVWRRNVRNVKKSMIDTIQLRQLFTILM